MLERDLFIAAWDISDATGRQAYLDSVCLNNAALRNRLERLLSRAHEDSDFLDQPAANLCSDWDSAWLAESSGFPQPEGEPVTQTGAAGDTGQTVLLNSAVPAASVSSTEVLSSSQLGTLFGRYRVERVLGAGGMGIVYLAEDLRLGRRVALKIPKFDEDGKLHLAERFRREARTMASVLHRHLCPIFDVAEQDSQHYLTMAFIDGETLGQGLKRGAKFTTRQIANLVRKLALALEAAHRAGVVHRDLKPANVMIDRDGEPIVMDFGLAWMVHETDARVTQSGAIIGTPAYMSPEQAEGEPDKIGAASDIYSLGAMLYELLTGRPVYSGSVTNVLYKLKHDAPTRPSVIRHEVDPQLEAICCKAISRRPEERFATAGEFAEALAGVLTEHRESEAPAEPRVIPSRPLTPALSPTSTSAPKSIPNVGEREQNSVPPRPRWRTALAGFAAMVLLAAVLLITTRNGTVEVTSPEGKLLEDVKVVVTRGGEEIELLQAENHWSAKLVHGEYQVQLRGGADRFEITRSQLTINRLGRAVVKLEIRPPVAGPQPTPVVAAPATPVTPSKPPTEPAKPPLPLDIDDQQAKAHQAAWAEHLGVPVEYTNSIGMKFVLIPPGEFTMGSTPAEIAEAVAAFGTGEDQTWPDFFRSEAPQHTVRLTQPFYLGIHEVTQGEYEQVLGKDRNRSCFAPGSFGGDYVVGQDSTRHPVEMVNWYDAAEFCAKLSEKEKLKPYYRREGEAVTPLEGTGYRLPTEAQWEFACRGGTTTKYWTGTTDQDLAQTGWFNFNSDSRTHAVGELTPNPFGLYDMHGNVEEWCQDHYAAYSEQLVENPSVTSTTEIRRVTRGGVWTFLWPLCRSSHRFARTPESWFNYTGFRVVLEVEAVKAAMKARTP